MQLHVGAFEAVFIYGDHFLVETTEKVVTYRPSYITDNFTMKTVFELKDNARKIIFLQNVKSVVKVRVLIDMRPWNGSVLWRCTL